MAVLHDQHPGIVYIYISLSNLLHCLLVYQPSTKQLHPNKDNLLKVIGKPVPAKHAELTTKILNTQPALVAFKIDQKDYQRAKLILQLAKPESPRYTLARQYPSNAELTFRAFSFDIMGTPTAAILQW